MTTHTPHWRSSNILESEFPAKRRTVCYTRMSLRRWIIRCNRPLPAAHFLWLTSCGSLPVAHSFDLAVAEVMEMYGLASGNNPSCVLNVWISVTSQHWNAQKHGIEMYYTGTWFNSFGVVGNSHQHTFIEGGLYNVSEWLHVVFFPNCTHISGLLN